MKKNKILVSLWIVVTTLSLVLTFVFGKMESIGTSLLVALLIIGAWTLVFAMVFLGLKRRSYLNILNQVNNIMKKHKENPRKIDGAKELESLLGKTQNSEEENLVLYYLSWMLLHAGKKEEARKTIQKISGFDKDPVFQEDFLLLKKELME